MGFTFSCLLDLPEIEGNRVSLDALKEKLPRTPAVILKDIYSDHGRKYEFQKQYEHLDLTQIEWTLHKIKAYEILECSSYGPFESWMRMVYHRADNFTEKGWSCIDARQDVVDYWNEHGTWLSPPCLILGCLVKMQSKLHLMEGHTRVGTLEGLVKRNILSPDAFHTVWLAV